MRETLINKLNAIVTEKNSYNNGYHYRTIVSDWENYGKSRTYFSYVETRDNSKHNVTVKFGYYDNISNEYIPEKYSSLLD